jgi:predicted kinase
MTTVHLICGFLGAGKTTFARELASREKALRFSPDELYLQLFTDGPTYELDAARFERLAGVVESLWTDAVRAGTDVVLDFGFWDRQSREQVRALAHRLGATPRLHWIRCSDETALARCLHRNGSPDAFLISREGYEEMCARFEAPSAEESPIVETG